MHCCAKNHKSPYKNLPFVKGYKVIDGFSENNALKVKFDEIYEKFVWNQKMIRFTRSVNPLHGSKNHIQLETLFS